jgi:hypothetical protein
MTTTPEAGAQDGDAGIATGPGATRSMTPPRISPREEDIVTAPSGTAERPPTPRTDEQNFDEGEDVSFDD